MKKNLRIDFSSGSSTLLDVIEKNPSFDAAKLRIAYTGKNRNNTNISKESFERAIPSMFNCPVVANYMREIDEIGSHDGEYVNGNYVNLTEPVGLVPESAQWYWDTVEDDGVIHQYLCTDVVLWKRQEAYQKIKDNGVTDQSMEIEVTDGAMTDGYYDIKDFTFTAFCLLGTAEPCFESAALMMNFEKDDFKEQYTEMLKDFKLAFASAEEQDKKEGNEDLKLNELLEKYQVSIEELEFEYDGMTDEELEQKFAEVFEDDSTYSEPDPEPEPEDNDDDSEPEDGEGEEDFALNSQIKDELHEALSAVEKISTDWGDYSRYWMVDFDIESSEIYFIDETDYKLYGCGYSMDGDSVILDIDSKQRKKYQIVDYIEGSGEQNYSISAELLNTFAAVVDTFNEKIDANNEELTRLQAFEAEILKKDRDAKEANLFARFEAKLANVEEYEELKKSASDYELDALEKELYALCGKLQFSLDKNNAPAARRVTPEIMPEEIIEEDSMERLFAWKKKEANK